MRIYRQLLNPSAYTINPENTALIFSIFEDSTPVLWSRRRMWRVWAKEFSQAFDQVRAQSAEARSWAGKSINPSDAQQD